jgi:hypothetical protein
MMERPRHARLKYGRRELTPQDTQAHGEEGGGRVRGGGRRQVKEDFPSHQISVLQ